MVSTRESTWDNGQNAFFEFALSLLEMQDLEVPPVAVNISLYDFQCLNILIRGGQNISNKE